MSDIQTLDRVQAYFASAADSMWRWADGARVIVWADGTTIAFREELVDVLEPFVPEGLPFFHGVVLLLAACRGKFPHAVLPREQATAPKATQAVMLRKEPLFLPWNDPANQDFSELIAQLRAVYELPAELRNNPRTKTILIQSVFDRCPEWRLQPAEEILRTLRDGSLQQESLNLTAGGASTPAAVEQFLHRRLLSRDALELRLRTGLDTLPEEADLDLKPAERVKQLLAQLQNDQEYEGLAKVTRDVMAALYLPRSLSEMDELALGGFSDISNRGSLDRLLPSELANDDMTLAARIALNEALYFRREPPANHPPGRFAVLLDAGVRTWGLPRVFGTAVALALVGREDHRGDVTTWRATRNGVEKIDLFTKAGLVDHLGVLQNYAHPGAALGAFFAQLAGEPELEAVLVTQRDTLADPEFQMFLREVKSSTFYVATVDRDGAFEMHLHPHRQTPLCQAVIPLESLFAPARAGSLRDARRDPNLPLILAIKPFPFLLPVVGKIQKIIRYSRQGGIAVMQDRRLLRWENSTQGAQVLTTALPKGKAVWVGTSNFGNKIHVLKHWSNPPTAVLTSWNAATDDVVTFELPLEDNQTVRAFTQGGVLFLANRKRIVAFDMDTGQSLGSVAPPDLRLPSSGRYFSQSDGTKVFLNFDGHSLQFQPVPLKAVVPSADILALFDREGYEGPWILTARGEVYSNNGEKVTNLGRVITNCQISTDGHRILVPSVGDRRNFQLINLETRICSFTPANLAPETLEPAVVPPTANVRVRFDAIDLPMVGGLSLRDTRGVWWRLTDVHAKVLALQSVKPPIGDTSSTRSFESLSISTSHPFALKAAAWDDGRRAWLDNRGVLHLRHRETSAPEISLVLSDTAMAAWSSDGLMCGSQFFIPAAAPQTAIPELMAKIHCFNPGW